MAPPLRRAVAARLSVLVLSLVVSANLASLGRPIGALQAAAKYTPRALLSTALGTRTAELATPWTLADDVPAVRCISHLSVVAHHDRLGSLPVPLGSRTARQTACPRAELIPTV